MGLRRATRSRGVAMLLLFALLWTQIAVAAYACPAVATAQQHAGASHPAGDCEHGSVAPAIADPDNPNLCLQHSQQGSQNADSGQQAPLAHVPASAGLPIEPALEVVHTGRRFADRWMLSRATSPPISIAHCCYRI